MPLINVSNVSHLLLRIPSDGDMKEAVGLRGLLQIAYITELMQRYAPISASKTSRLSTG